MLTVDSPEFVSWFTAAQAIVDEYRNQHFPTLPRVILSVKPGQKMVKVISAWENKSHCSVWGFVAMVDNTTKSLGIVKAGDVMKAASFNVPAKHARGNILDSTNGTSRLTAHGPSYLYSLPKFQLKTCL